uniref:Kbp_3 protein n=1 Tax=Fopius arisanus TaxID=64838 RepID=A0A0C9PTU2_9HYME
MTSEASTAEVAELSRFMSKNQKLHEASPIFGEYRFDFVNSPLAHRNFYVVDLDCAGAYELLIQANETGNFIAPTKWLILQDLRATANSMFNGSLDLAESNEDGLRRIFQDFHIFPDSEIIVGQRLEGNIIKLLSPYRPSLFRRIIIEDRGTWASRSGIQFRNYHVSSRRRTDVQQTPMKACAVMTNPDTMNHLEDLKGKNVDVISKVGYLLSKLLVARMNTTVAFNFAPTWGYQDKNGSWSGMIGQIIREEVDFGGTATFLTPARLGLVDYIQLYTPNRVRFIFRQPPLSHISNLFTLPFSRSVWIGIAVFSCIGFVILYLSMAWEWQEVKDIPTDQKLWGDLEMKPAFGDNFLILIGAITQQGSAYEPRSVPARIVILMLLVFCLSLYAAYAANIVALLQSTSDCIKTVEDLMNSPLKIGVLDIVYNHYYLGSFEDPMRKEFYERRIKGQKNIWMSLEEGIHRVRNDLFAFHTDVTMGYGLVQSTFGEDEKCGFEEIDYLYVSDPQFAIRRKSPYREILRVGGLWLKETGLRQRYINILCNGKPLCNNQKKFVGVGTIECYAAYLTIGYGMILTFGILVLEIIWSKYSKIQVEKEKGEHTSIADEKPEDQADFNYD